MTNIFCLINNVSFNVSNLLLNQESIKKTNIYLNDATLFSYGEEDENERSMDDATLSILRSYGEEDENERSMNNMQIKKYYKLDIIKTNKNFISINNIDLICNGIIYNSEKLFEILNIKPHTIMNFEIIIHMYLNFGIEETLKLINGDFSFILIDNQINVLETKCKIFISRDIFGLKPLYYLKSKNYTKPNNDIYAFSSDINLLKKITRLCKYKNNNYLIKEYPSATYSYFELDIKALSFWEIRKENEYYYIPNSLYIPNNYYDNDFDNHKRLKNYLMNSILNRMIFTNNNNCAFIISLNKYDVFLFHYFVKNKMIMKYYLMNYLDEESMKNKDTTNYEKEKINLDEINKICNDFNIKYEKINIPLNKVSNYFFLKKVKYIYSSLGAKELFDNEMIMNDENERHFVSMKNNILFVNKNRKEKIMNISKTNDYHLFYNCMKLLNITIITPFLDKNFIDFYLSSCYNLNLNLNLFIE